MAVHFFYVEKFHKNPFCVVLLVCFGFFGLLFGKKVTPTTSIMFLVLSTQYTMQKIKFTKENEENNKLVFLVVQITKKSDCIKTLVFQKNTNLGIYVHKMRQLCSESIQTKLGLDVTAPRI